MGLITILTVLTLSVSGGASAKNAPGSAKWCKHHPKSTLSACQKTGGSGPGGSPASLMLTVSPNPIVETGGSDVYAVFTVAADPVYAEKPLEIVSGLGDRCGGGVLWLSNLGSFSGSTAFATIDDDGNASVTVLGASCAAGSVQVIADVVAGTNPTYATTFTIDPPTPSI